MLQIQYFLKIYQKMCISRMSFILKICHKNTKEKNKQRRFYLLDDFTLFCDYSINYFYFYFIFILPEK